MNYFNNDFAFSDLENGDTLYMYIEYLNSFHGPGRPEITTNLNRALSNSGSDTKIFKLTVEELKVKEVVEEKTVRHHKRILE